MLLCLARGRWFGLRGALLLATAALFLLHLTFDGPPGLLPLIEGALFLLAAWGAVLEPGTLGTRPWVARASLVLITCFGAFAALLLLVAGLEMLPWKRALVRGVYGGFEVTQDGAVLKITSRADGSGQVVTDMTGHVVTDERYVGNGSYENLCQFVPLGFGFWSARESSRNWRSSLGDVSPIRSAGAPGKENWYVLVRQKYLIGYDVLSHRCIGIFDRQGFKPPNARPVPFASRFNIDVFSSGNPLLFWTRHQLYAFLLGDRQMTVEIFEVTA